MLVSNAQVSHRSIVSRDKQIQQNSNVKQCRVTAQIGIPCTVS